MKLNYFYTLLIVWAIISFLSVPLSGLLDLDFWSMFVGEMALIVLCYVLFWDIVEGDDDDDKDDDEMADKYDNKYDR